MAKAHVVAKYLLMGDTVPPAGPTAFEMEVRRLNLQPDEYKASLALKKWVSINRHRVYVPEKLLGEWGFFVDA